MNRNRIFLKYIGYDMLAAVLVWVAFVVFRKYVNDIQVFEVLRLFTPNYNYLGSLIFFPFYCVFVHSLAGFYVNSYKKNRINLVLSTFSSSAIISTSVFFALKLGDALVSYEYFYFSLLVLFGFQFLFTYFLRNVVFSQIEHNYRTKKWTINTLIVGTGENASKIANDLEKHAQRNTIIGFVSINKRVGIASEKIVGNISQVASVIEKYDIQEAIVALDNDVDETELFKIINLLYRFDVEIQFTPRLFEILSGSAKISKLEISPLVSITQPSMSDWEASVKRFMDIVLSTVSLIVLSPFLLFFMIRIKQDSKGPIMYKQERIGRYGKPFNILKFRTMYIGSENGTPKLSSANDERITPVGRILRKYRIDEIPQFWNIIKGDMSLVGPRPERRYYINRIIEDAPYYCLLYKIRPGLTSWGPIKIGYSDSVEKMVERLNYDVIYLDNMSLVTDMKILIYTFEIIFKGKGV